MKPWTKPLSPSCRTARVLPVWACRLHCSSVMPVQGVADTIVTLRRIGLTEVNVRMERYADASTGVAARAEKEGSSVILAGGKRRSRGHGSYVRMSAVERACAAGLSQ